MLVPRLSEKYAGRELNNIMRGTFLFCLMSTISLTLFFIKIRELVSLTGFFSSTPLFKYSYLI